MEPLSIVLPQPRTERVIGRPKTRSALRVSATMAVVALSAAIFRPEWPGLAVSLAVSAGIAAAIALVLRVAERPRPIAVIRSSLTLDLPVIHVNATPAPGERHDTDSTSQGK